MDRIEDLVKKEPNRAWEDMSQKATEEALEFSKSLQDGARWQQNALGKISAEIDSVGSRLEGLQLKDAFAFRAIARVAGEYFVGTNPDPDNARSTMKKIVDIGVQAQSGVVKQFARRDLEEGRRIELQEFQMLLLEAAEIFSKVSGVAADRALLKPVGL